VGKEERGECAVAADGAGREGIGCVVEEGTGCFRRGVDFVDVRDAEARLEGLPDVWAQAVAKGGVYVVLLVERRGRRGEQITTGFANIVQDGGAGGADLGPEGCVGEFGGEAQGSGGTQDGAYGKQRGSAVVEGHAGVDDLAVEAQPQGHALGGGGDFAPRNHDGLGEAGGGGARGVEEQGHGGACLAVAGRVGRPRGRQGEDVGLQCSGETGDVEAALEGERKRRGRGVGPYGRGRGRWAWRAWWAWRWPRRWTR